MGRTQDSDPATRRVSESISEGLFLPSSLGDSTLDYPAASRRLNSLQDVRTVRMGLVGCATSWQYRKRWFGTLLTGDPAFGLGRLAFHRCGFFL